MSNRASPSRKLVCHLSAIMLAAAIAAPARPAAAANPNLNFHGGYTRNLIIDVILWGPFTGSQARDVRDYLTNFARYLNGWNNPPGKEPAVRYYGVWAAQAGTVVVDGDPLPPDLVDGSGALTRDGADGIINRAEAGAFGPPLPVAPNRIAVLVTQGVTMFSDPNFVSHGGPECGDHWYANRPRAMARWDADCGNKAFSHEVLEAATDPTPFAGWATDELGGLDPGEAGDVCNTNGSDSPRWLSCTGLDCDDISGIEQITLDPAFPEPGFGPGGDTCQVWEPEQYAPIAATYSSDGMWLNAYFRTQGNELGLVIWNLSSGTHGGVINLHSPPTALIQGKPSVVNTAAFGLGDVVFVRAADDALWQWQNSAWTPMGGVLFGDPSAAVWSGNGMPYVFALGTDNTVYKTPASMNGSGSQWAQVPGSAGRFFGSPPRALAGKDGTIDVFTVSEYGNLTLFPFSPTTGWMPLVDLGIVDSSRPHHTPVGSAWWTSGRVDVFGTTEVSVVHRSMSAGTWSAYDTRPELGTSPAGTPGVVASAPGRVDAFVIDRQHNLWHAFYLDSTKRWSRDASAIATDAVGDPVALSRGSAHLDVLYRGADGALKHLEWQAASGWLRESASPGNSIY